MDIYTFGNYFCAAHISNNPPLCLTPLDSLRLLLLRQTIMVDVLQSLNGDEGARDGRAGEAQSIVTLERCNNSRCLTCPDFCENNYFKSTVTTKVYNVVAPENSILGCRTKNLVYLLTCKQCLVQYVGETKQQFNVRNNSHRRSTKNVNIHTGCPIIHEHFTEGLCAGVGYTCQIIEKIPDNGSEQELQNLRRQKEFYWIKELRTIYPFGLNSRLDAGGQEVRSINTYFNKLTRYRDRRRGRGRGHDWNIDDILDNIKAKLEHSIDQVTRYCCKTFPQIPRCKLKILAQHLLDNNVPEFIRNIAIKYITHCNNNTVVEQKSKKLRPPLKLTFINKGIEMINLGRILHDPLIKNAFPLEQSDSPMIVYKYTKPVRNKIVNYRQTVQSAVYDEWRANEGRCDCHNSPFKDEYHDHVITGNLDIVQNRKLRTIFSKGTNYREAKTINWRNNKKEIVNSLSNYINSQCEKSGIPLASFSEWKSRIIQAINEKINVLKRRIPYYRPSHSIFTNEMATQELDRLQEKYVITVVDKAGKNYSFICKWYYMKILYNEIGTLNNNNEENINTYERINENDENIIQNQTNFNKSVNIDTKIENKKLPFIYWIPKFHKNPVKARFIVSSSVCATKQMASYISKSLKLIMKGRKRYCDVIEEFTGTKRWWVIDNNQEVLKIIKKINENRHAKSVNTYDFSTLYTNIPHNSLKEALSIIIEKCFANSKMKYITLNNCEAYWSKNQSTNLFSLSKPTLLSCINFLIDNTYFKCGDLIYRQNIGIPMGTDPGPDFANLFLHHYEFNYIHGNTRTKYGVCKKLSKSFRYIDDIVVFNGETQFEAEKSNIYPQELTLNKENNVNQKASFLDIDIEIIDNKFVTSLYDKRKDFNFQIVNYPFLCGNVPKRQSYGVFLSQVIRFSRVCMKYQCFIRECRILTRKLLRQGYKEETMRFFFDKLSNVFQRVYNKDEFTVKNDVFEN